MSTKFKVGDRVRLTGEAWEKHGMREEVYSVKLIVGGVPHIAVNNGRHMGIYRDGMDYSATLVEPAPPPDTRKRLREYTDLADGDVVVIAGVEFTVDGDALTSGEACIWATLMPWAAMFVDEVRRKPRTKKRRVYEEVEDDSHKTGDLIVTKKGYCTAHSNVPRDDDETIYRLIEETEVPR